MLENGFIFCRDTTEFPTVVPYLFGLRAQFQIGLFDPSMALLGDIMLFMVQKISLKFPPVLSLPVGTSLSPQEISLKQIKLLKTDLKYKGHIRKKHHEVEIITYFPSRVQYCSRRLKGIHHTHEPHPRYLRRVKSIPLRHGLNQVSL